MDKKIRLGVVGYGGRGRSMARLSASFAGVEVVAVAEISASALTLAGEDFPAAKLFPEFPQMLVSGLLDALLVETPGWDHTRFCIQGLEHGIPVISDVPFAYTLEEGNDLWAAAQKSKAMFTCGANPNMAGYAQAAVDLYERGLLGEPFYLEAEYMHALGDLFERTPWRKQFPCIKYCTHSLGPLLRVLKDDLRTVSCVGTGSPNSGFENYHDLMTASFQTEKGAIVKLMTSFSNNYHGGNHSYRILGTEGSFERFSGRGDTLPAKTIFNSNKLAGCEMPTDMKVDTMLPSYAGKAGNSGHGGMDFVLLDRFFRALRGEGENPVTLREGLRMTLPGIYAEKSAALNGEKLTISYPWD